jgi:hypothetical protein
MSIVPSTIPAWQEEKRLSCGDQIWILTDVEVRWSRYRYNAPDQEWFHVGAIDLNTGCIGTFRFSRDDAFAILKAGIAAAPWTTPQPHAIALHRRSHGSTSAGRFVGWVTLAPTDPALHAIVPHAKRMFANAGLSPNFVAATWKKLEERAERELKIERVVLGQTGSFSAGEIIAATGEKRSAVSGALKRLVMQHKLVPEGKGKRWTTTLPPPIVEFPQRSA